MGVCCKFVLKAIICQNDNSSDGYYIGQSFKHQHSRYACVDRDIKKAKIYTNRNKALRACKMEFFNYRFEVVNILDK